MPHSSDADISTKPWHSPSYPRSLAESKFGTCDYYMASPERWVQHRLGLLHKYWRLYIELHEHIRSTHLAAFLTMTQTWQIGGCLICLSSLTWCCRLICAWVVTMTHCVQKHEPYPFSDTARLAFSHWQATGLWRFSCRGK